jgi:hypothetical protein
MSFPGPLRLVPDRLSQLFDWLAAWQRDLEGIGIIADRGARELGEELAPYFRKAVPFIWTQQMWSMAANAAESMPRNLPPLEKLNLPFDTMLFAWKNYQSCWSLGIAVDEEKDLLEDETAQQAAERMEVYWMLIHRTSETTALLRCYVGQDKTYGSEHGGIFTTKTAEWDVNDEDSFFIRGIFAFLESPYVVYEYPGSESENRAQRKRILRIQETLPPLMVEPKVVVLRRALIKKDKDEQGKDVNWTHQWMVSGHWRQQWYPSANAHGLIWVPPHLKGPPELPLKTPLRLVMR